MDQRECVWTEESVGLGEEDGEGGQQCERGVERGCWGQLSCGNFWVVIGCIYITVV